MSINSKQFRIAALVLSGLLLILALLLMGKNIRGGMLNDKILQATRISGSSFPKTLTDPTGKSYVLTHAPDRIVSVTLATDEMLSALVKPDRMAGVSYLVDNPAMSNVPGWYPERIPRVHADAEEILALQPDLVFVAAYTRAETVRMLLGAGIPVVRLSRYDSFEEISSNIELVAAATGSEVKARSLIAGLQQQVLKMQAKVKNLPRPRVLFYNLAGYTEGIGTRIDQTIRIAGGENVMRETGSTGSAKISSEIAIGLQADIILLTGSNQNSSDENSSDQSSDTGPVARFMRQPAWKNVPAIRNGQVYLLHGAWILSVSQFAWDGIDIIARDLHPEIFH
jgi:iron complex transport system substrate-binding protein